MSLIMPGAGLFKQIHAAEIGYVYAGGERIARTIDHALLQSYVADNKDSVVNVVDGVTPLAGVTYQYDAYGLVLKSPAMDIPNPFQYNGEWTDDFSQLQYLRARFYTPTLMRFVQQDSYDLANRFNYGDGNPIVNSDPSGHFSVVNFAISFVPGYGTYNAFNKNLPIFDKIISIGVDAAVIIGGVYIRYQKIVNARQIDFRDVKDIIEVEEEEEKRVETIQAFAGKNGLVIEEQPNHTPIGVQPNQSHRSSFEFGEDANIENIENISVHDKNLI